VFAVTATQGPWRLEVFAADNGREPFTAFADSLSDTAFAALDAALRHVLAVRGIGLVSTEWLKPLGQGLHEFRVRHTASEIARMFAGEPAESVPGPGVPILLRVFVHFHGHRVILLLSGYDKQADASRKRQEREIAAARKYLVAWRQQEARRKARAQDQFAVHGRARARRVSGLVPQAVRAARCLDMGFTPY
jgi:hypothetical protein